MPDTAQARAEKAYPNEHNCRDVSCYFVSDPIRQRREGYVRGWTESQREPISDAEVEAALGGFHAAAAKVEISATDWRSQCMRAALTAAAQARVSAESEKP